MDMAVGASTIVEGLRGFTGDLAQLLAQRGCSTCTASEGLRSRSWEGRRPSQTSAHLWECLAPGIEWSLSTETVERMSIQWMDGGVGEGLALWNVKRPLQQQDPILNNCTSFLGHQWLTCVCTVMFSKKTEQQ